MSWWQFEYRKNRGMDGKLQVKPTNHWQEVDRQYWIKCGVSDGRINYSMNKSLVILQHSLVAAGKCEDGKMILAGDLYRDVYNSRWVITERKYYRCPYHEDLLPNYEQFADDLKKYEDGIERFSITNIMLPASPFFSTSIIPILNQNITTITSLELVNCNLHNTDVDLISKFVIKNKVLGVLDLSNNNKALFGIGCNRAAKLLAKSMKKHPELAYVNLSKTGITMSNHPGFKNEALKLLLDGCKGINSLIIDNTTLDEEGLALVTDFLVKKNSLTEFSLDSAGIGEGKTERPTQRH